ncbi:uncharacterized protein [Palaemon carinicauda]|uniref:uncharacterized protein n=1 Tax=Palaemon carinicauda TaxID=392227 RepID=UPI0035B5F1B3
MTAASVSEAESTNSLGTIYGDSTAMQAVAPPLAPQPHHRSSRDSSRGRWYCKWCGYLVLTISGSSLSSVNVSSPPAVGPTATTISHFLGGGAALFTPPARFNNNLLPSFADTTATNVTVIRGKTVYLHCHVLHLGTKTVSWVRHEDIQVLTVGRITFTNDDRFEAMNKPGSDVWMLRIRYPQMRDAGKYECQVSMRPPVARVIELNVVGL